MPLSTHPAKLIFCWILFLLLPVMRGLRRGTGSLHSCGRFAGKLCGKEIISVVNIANKSALSFPPKKKKIEQVLYLVVPSDFNLKNCVYIYEFLPHFDDTVVTLWKWDVFLFFFVLCSALVVPSLEKRCNLQKGNRLRGLHFKRVHQKLHLYLLYSEAFSVRLMSASYISTFRLPLWIPRITLGLVFRWPLN